MAILPVTNDSAPAAGKPSKPMTVRQLKGMLGKMISLNPHWKVYLLGADIDLVKRILDYQSDATIFRGETQAKLVALYHRVTKRQLHLFTRYPLGNRAVGCALRKLLSRILIGEATSFGTSTQLTVMAALGIKYWSVPSDHAALAMMHVFEQTSDEMDLVVLRRIKAEHFDPLTSRLKPATREIVLAPNIRAHRDEVEAAVEELELILSQIH
jgi:hypothetical protein